MVFFISVRFRFGFLEKKVGFGSESVLFGSVKKSGSVRILVICYSCNSRNYSDSGLHDFDVTDITHNNDSDISYLLLM